MRWSRIVSHRTGLAILSLALLATLLLQRLEPADRLDLLAFDQLAPWLASVAVEPGVVVVEIDQQSLDRLGRWPWPRRLHAELIELLASARPRVIGYDVLFAEPAAHDPEGDAALVRAVAAASVVVLPIIAELPARSMTPLEILPFGDLPEVAAGLGHGHLAADPDGRLRRLHLKAGVGEAYWPAFASTVHAIASRAAAPLAATGPPTPGPAEALAPLVLDWVVGEAVLVPMPRDAATLRHLSALDVLRGRGAGDLAGSVVLVGVTARGLQAWADIGPRGAGNLAPPVHFNAHAVRALLQGETLAAPGRSAVVSAMLAGGALAPWLGSLLLGARPAVQRTLLALAPLVPLGIGIVALLGWRLVLPFASVATVIAGLLIAHQLLLATLHLRRARLERNLAHAALTNVADAVLTVDSSGRVDYANPAAERLLAAPSRPLVGERLDRVAPELGRLLRGPSRGGSAARARRHLLASLDLDDRPAAGAWPALPLTAADGSQRIVKAMARSRGGVWRHGHVIALNDVTDERRLLDEVAFRATHDGLTNLPNRHLLIDRLGGAIERARRRQRLVGTAFLDIDRLKSINDALGHAVGDAVLVEVASRLTASGRSSDTVGRLGGDEFVLLLEDLANRGEVESGIERYRQCLARPVVVDGRRFEIKASIGVACFPADAETPDDLLRRADAAMYRAKSAGRDQVVYFDAALHGEEGGGLLLDAALRQGIGRNELELHYQPRIDLARRRPSGVESLVRWRHPEQGFLPPGRFIGLAEETGSIVELGRWVLAKACADLAGPTLRDSGLSLSINVSVVQLKRDQGFVDFVRTTLARHAIHPDRLELEITESLFLDPSLPMLGRKLAELAGLGVHLSIDDFGTGYSSLAYINRFPFDRIKIDRSFVHNAGRDKGAQAIIRAIVGLSEALAKKTTAEGVEETDQLAFLDELHCNEAQGYLFGRPVPLPELAQKLAA
jgi:diguanylate cyclase (GGDEF)-like protein